MKIIMKFMLFAFFYLQFTKGSIITSQDMDREPFIRSSILNYFPVMHQRSCESAQIWKHGRCQNIKTKHRFKINPMRLVELIKKRYELNGKILFYIPI